MKKLDLQMFANPVSGKKIVYLFRVLDSATTDDAVAMAKKLVSEGESINNAAKITAAHTPYKKSEIYRALL